MWRIKNLKFLQVVLSLGIALLIPVQMLFPTSINAQNLNTVIKKTDLRLDLTSVEDSGNYAQPRTIIVAPIFLDTNQEVDDKEWYRGLFYYFSSDRYLFKDIPVHYVVDGKGKVYEGIKGGVEKKLIIKNSSDTPIVILYLAKRGESDFTLSAKSTLKSFLLQLTEENGIKPADNVKVKGMKLNIDEKQKQAVLAADEIFGSWTIGMQGIVKYLQANYQPTKKNYKIEVTEFKNPESKVTMGSQLVINIKLKNTGQYTIFPESDSELLLTKKDGGDSQLFLNGQWVSKTQAPILGTGDILLPGEEEKFDIKMTVPYSPGAFNENFIIKTANGVEIKGSDIQVKLNIDRGNVKLLEIQATETGTLNIREQPRASAPVVDKASPGQRYIWLERDQNGWYKIKLESADGSSNQRTGWVLGRYAKEL